MKKTSTKCQEKDLLQYYEKDFLLGAMKKTSSTNAKKKTSYEVMK